MPAAFGLGILFSVDASWSGAIADVILPSHRNRLIAKLEQNRLANYLTVLQ